MHKTQTPCSSHCPLQSFLMSLNNGRGESSRIGEIKTIVQVKHCEDISFIENSELRLFSFLSLPAIIEVRALFELERGRTRRDVRSDPASDAHRTTERTEPPSQPKITQVNYVDEAYLAAEEFLWCNRHTHTQWTPKYR